MLHQLLAKSQDEIRTSYKGALSGKSEHHMVEDYNFRVIAIKETFDLFKVCHSEGQRQRLFVPASRRNGKTSSSNCVASGTCSLLG